jgi:hypothetical protein
MSDQEKQEKLKKRREAYQQKRSSKDSTHKQEADQEKQEKLSKHREAYRQKKKSIDSDNKKQERLQKKCIRERENYANMQPD